jgi:hypothetical protein
VGILWGVLVFEGGRGGGAQRGWRMQRQPCRHMGTQQAASSSGWGQVGILFLGGGQGRLAKQALQQLIILKRLLEGASTSQHSALL